MKTPPLFERVYPTDLRAAELACLKRRREKAKSTQYQPATPAAPAANAPATPATLPEDTIGVALSGGGIRSATFCLGILQALAARGLLRHIDFLSTVSGGGYVGAFLGALIQRPESLQANGRPASIAPNAIFASPASEPLQWLRDHGRYMSPNGAGDEIIAGAVYLRNLVAIHVVLAITVVTLLAGATLLRAWAVARWPGYLPEWSAAWPWLSPFVCCFRRSSLAWSPYRLAGRIGSSNATRTGRSSDWVAAPTALLVAAAAFGLLRNSPPQDAAVHWTLRFFAVTPLLAMLAWGAALFRPQTAGQRGRRSVHALEALAMARDLAGQVTAAAPPSRSSTRWDARLRLAGVRSGRIGRAWAALMGAVAALIAAVGSSRRCSANHKEDGTSSLPKNLLAGVARGDRLRLDPRLAVRLVLRRRVARRSIPTERCRLRWTSVALLLADACLGRAGIAVRPHDPVRQ